MPPPFILNPKLRPGYAPSPQKPTLYNVNGAPTIPTSYSDDWQLFTDLTPEQVAWHMAQAEWQNYLAYVALSPATAEIGVPAAVVNATLLAAGKTLATVALPSPLQPLGGLPTA